MSNSNKISMANIIVKHLRGLPNNKGLTVTEAKAAADAIIASMSEQLTERDGEVVLGKIGKVFSKRYANVVRYNPSSKKHEPRGAYKTVRFKPFKAAKSKI